MNIDRTLFWFKDGDEMITAINNNLFCLGVLLNRLLNEQYDGKKINFINLDLATNHTYELYPNLPKDEPYYYGGHLRYYGLFDREQFNLLNWIEQKKYVWEKAYKYLQKSAEWLKNKKLSEAVEYAYKKGLEIDLNPDFRLIESESDLLGRQFKASIWINFKEDGMYSKFTLEKGGETVFENHIDKTNNGVEFFLDIYKEITDEGDCIVIKGRKDVNYLPLKIPKSEIEIYLNEFGAIDHKFRY